MKNKIGFLAALLCILPFTNNLAQRGPGNPHILNQAGGLGSGILPNGFTVSDTTYDVGFYHIDIEIGLWAPSIKGRVSYELNALVDGMESLILDLDDAFSIDSISSPVTAYDFENNALTVFFDQVYAIGDPISFTVYYQGEPPLAGGYKGLRYETHNGNEPIIASLSTPYLAHTWWPCKDGTSDKADSTYIDITIQDTLLSGIPVIAVSNGLLEGVETANGKKTFQWRHRYPSVPYYIMVAISNYVKLEDTYQGPAYSFPLDYYVFDDHVNEATLGVADVPVMLDFFNELFGPYPFRDEKYGMTQLGYYGGIENQTNSIINNMGIGWTDVTVHELAHQWFADMITCGGWNHGWLNEGFASYSEALYQEHVAGWDAYKSHIANDEYYNGGTLYRDEVSNPFLGVFVSIIYSKGSYVLHMLRGVLGDDLFFESIYTYATDPAFQYANATTEDFQQSCETVSGLDLDYFFEQWIYDAYYPKYRYNFEQEPNGNTFLFLEQTQVADGWRETFTMPLEIEFTFADQTDTLVRVFNDQAVQSFFFTFDQTIVNVVLDPNDWVLKEATFEPDFTVSTTQLSALQPEVYPNPATEVVSIKFPDTIQPWSGSLRLLNALGQVVLRRSVTVSPGIVIELDLSGISPGIYQLAIQKGQATYAEKIMVIR